MGVLEVAEQRDGVGGDGGDGRHHVGLMAVAGVGGVEGKSEPLGPSLCRSSVSSFARLDQHAAPARAWPSNRMPRALR
jgi:hypothetical protein